jgi:Fe-S-cluster containining protein
VSGETGELKGLRFECTQCGACCTNHGDYAHVYLNPEEVGALARHVGLSVRAFRRKYTFVDEYGWTQLVFTGPSCVFLDEETQRCKVYAARPVQCSTFPFWRSLIEGGRWTKEAGRICEGVGRGPLHTIDEAEERMVAFEEAEED